MVNAVRKKIITVALFLPEIRELIKNKDFNGLKAIIKNLNSVDLAHGWRLLEPQEKIIVFKILSTKKSVEVF